MVVLRVVKTICVEALDGDRYMYTRWKRKVVSLLSSVFHLTVLLKFSI